MELADPWGRLSWSHFPSWRWLGHCRPADFHWLIQTNRWGIGTHPCPYWSSGWQWYALLDFKWPNKNSEPDFHFTNIWFSSATKCPTIHEKPREMIWLLVCMSQFCYQTPEAQVIARHLTNMAILGSTLGHGKGKWHRSVTFMCTDIFIEDKINKHGPTIAKFDCAEPIFNLSYHPWLGV